MATILPGINIWTCLVDKAGDIARIGVCVIMFFTPVQAKTLTEKVQCAARLMDMPAPPDPVVVTLPRQSVRNVCKSKNTTACFKRPRLIVLSRPDDLGHELGHYVLSANGRPSSHDNPEANRKVVWLAQKFRGWCE